MDVEKIKLLLSNIEILIQHVKEEITEPAKVDYDEVLTYYDDSDVEEYYDDKEDV